MIDLFCPKFIVNKILGRKKWKFNLKIYQGESNFTLEQISNFLKLDFILCKFLQLLHWTLLSVTVFIKKVFSWLFNEWRNMSSTKFMTLEEYKSMLKFMSSPRFKLLISTRKKCQARWMLMDISVIIKK